MFEQAEQGGPRHSSRWFVTLCDSIPSSSAGYTIHRVGPNLPSQNLYLGNQVESCPPLFAAGRQCAVVVGGVLFNWRDIEDEMGEADEPDSNPAQVVLAAYARWGEDLLRRLRGPFALVIWDAARAKLLCARDPLGGHPFFYAEGGSALYFSSSIDVLLEQPSVSTKLNRIAMADYLSQRFQKKDETFFESVRRIPAGHALSLNGSARRLFRYWDPAPNDEVAWLKPDEVGRFDEVFDRAVSRCLSIGPASVFLSGGLDSVSVAAVALERTQAEGLPRPLALSLAFPHPETNEEAVQRSVATQLGLPQVVKPFFEATGEKGLLHPALRLSASLPAPLLNIWLPAYAELAREGSERGCAVVLTGNGGDEWLTLGPFIAADLLRAFDLVGFYRLWQSHRRSYRLSAFPLLRNLLWRFGAAPIIVPPVHRVVKRFAPWSIKLRHRLTRPDWMPPKWVAPDSELRGNLIQRLNESDNERRQGPDSFYDRAGRASLDHSIMSWEAEELFSVYRRARMSVLHPFWDADLVDLLYRTPPFMLNSGGRTKGLVRDSLKRRFPKLGFDRQRKVLALDFYKGLVAQDAAQVWDKLGGATVLDDLEVVDGKSLRSDLQSACARLRNAKDAFRIWSVLNLETWARAHVS